MPIVECYFAYSARGTNTWISASKSIHFKKTPVIGHQIDSAAMKDYRLPKRQDKTTGRWHPAYALVLSRITPVSAFRDVTLKDGRVVSMCTDECNMYRNDPKADFVAKIHVRHDPDRYTGVNGVNKNGDMLDIVWTLQETGWKVRGVDEYLALHYPD